jgi:predicted unusual protein kinase regulating ubiquinone biosynthesis (AarF/ABC1/UbiB family)
MKIPAFVPSDLRQLLRFVPTRGWDAIEWSPLLTTLRQVSTRYVTGQGTAGLRATVSATLPGIDLVRKLRRADNLASIDDGERLTAAGDDILRLYFAQWLLDDGMFIDLRASRFGLTGEDRLQFAPNGLWIRLRPEFREGMLALYRSFYSDDDSAFDAALRQMGMLQDSLTADAEAEMKALLHAHFGIDQRAQTFSIDSFKASFDELFAFFVAHDYKLHSDFVFVGFYLITLYLALEQGGQAHDVRSICSEVLLDA